MEREDFRDKVLDRSSWKSGPWDNEPDYCEWTTSLGDPVWAARLDSGAWFYVLETPYPSDIEGSAVLAFHHCMRDKTNHEIELSPGMGWKVREGIHAHCGSMEHWEAPGPSERAWWRGPYKTLEDVKQIAETLSNIASEVLKEEEYKTYFD
jgi:hypothetical protein